MHYNYLVSKRELDSLQILLSSFSDKSCILFKFKIRLQKKFSRKIFDFLTLKNLPNSKKNSCLLELDLLYLYPMQIRDKKGPETIGSVLGNLFKDLGLERRIKEQEVIINWEKIVGNNIADNTKPFKIEGAKLFLKVKSSAWRNELFYLKKELITKLNNSAKQELVKDIIFLN
jgi:hypothetical protein